MTKVTFDGPARRIQIDAGITELDVQIDLYSPWKEWTKTNAQYPKAFETAAGNPVTATLKISPYFFLKSPWKIRPWNMDHSLLIVGNLYPETVGYDMFEDTVDPYLVRVNLERSVNSLTQTVGSGLSATQDTRLAELWRILGLDPTLPMVVTQNARTAGAVSQSIVEIDGTVTVTRL